MQQKQARNVDKTHTPFVMEKEVEETKQQQLDSQTVVVFGADGRTGREVVRELTESGHNVIASIFDEKSKDLFLESVATEVGDVLNAEYVDSLVSRADVIISAVGHIKNTDPLMQTKGTKNIITAMKKHNKKRILSLTGTGVRILGDAPSWIDHILNFTIAHIDHDRINDGIKHAQALQESGLDWTILRVLKLTKSTSQPLEYNLTLHGPAELFTSRKKVAHILVDLINKPEYFQKMPVSSK